ncbi:hypothetical protein GCM10027020_04740 [Nocardioides salsibiostraticola]
MTLHRDLILAQAPGVIAQVDFVRLYDVGLTFEVSLRVTAERLRQTTVTSIEMSESLWVDTPDVQVSASIDGLPLRRFHANQDWSDDPGLHATGGQWGIDGPGGHAKCPWWINAIPTRDLSLYLSWQALELEGHLALDAATWRQRLPHVPNP